MTTTRPSRNSSVEGTPTSPIRRLGFLVTPRWIALEIAVVAFTLSCYFFLAPWQFHRSAEHDAQQAAISAAINAPTVPVSSLMSTDGPPPDGARWREVTASGRFEPSDQSYVRLRHDNGGNPANEVLVPFVTTGGTTLLVDRGYVPYITVQEGKEELPALPTGTLTISGRVQPNEVDPKHRPSSTAPDGRTAYTAASSTILDGSHAPVYDGFLQLTKDSPGVISAIGIPQDNARPFFSYAIQWLSFGAIAVFGLGYFIYKEFTDPVDGQIYVTDDDDPEDEGRGDEAVRRVTTGRYDAPDASPTKPRRARRTRSGFDKSQLYDPE